MFEFFDWYSVVLQVFGVGMIFVGGFMAVARMGRDESLGSAFGLAGLGFATVCTPRFC